MGNSKSSHQLSHSFDKDTEFNSEADDGGFLEAKLKALEAAALSRSQTGRKSFHYIRMKENQDLAMTSTGQTNCQLNDKEFVRVHSLPANRIKKKSSTLGAKRIDAINGKGNNAKISVQGFDMFRHHLGQMNCDVALFEQLESEINLLNDKLQDLEETRQNCLTRLSELDSEVRQGQLLAPATKVSTKRSKANDLALKIISSYIQRIDNLMNFDKEPFLVDVKRETVQTLKTCAQQSVSKGQSLSSQFEQSLQMETTSSANATARSKRQQIKDAYNQLIKSIMPQLFGKQFAHRDETSYCSFKENLTKLREQVNGISTSDEQKFISARNIFLAEMDNYLRIIDEMVTCTEKECHRCKT